MAKKVVKKITKIEPVSSGSADNAVEVKRVCAYCRVSTNSADQKNSFEAQVDYYTRLIGEKEGWVLAGIYADEGRTGTKLYRRDDFQQMMQDCRQGRIDLILTKSVTRFARNTLDSIKAIRELKALEIGVFFEKERVNTLMEKSEQMITISSSIAQGESESISTNNKWAVVRRFRNGTFIISSPPYGYENNEYGEMVIKKEEAEIVRWIFDEYLGGKGSYTIAAELETAGIPTIRGAKEWQDSVVKGILQNCAYEGDLLLQKTYTTDGVPFIRKNNRGELPQYLIADDHEPIITREEAAAVRQIYEYRRERQCVEDTSVYQNRYAFSSRIVCGECGTIFRRQKIYIGKPYEKIQWCCYQHIKDLSLIHIYVVRFGGEEFVAGLWGDNEVELYSKINLLFSKVEEHKFSKQEVTISISLGCSYCHVSELNGWIMSGMLKAADGMLYECKENGRQQYRVAKFEEATQLKKGK